jgi:DNA-binding response OmpR family regulator
MLKGTALLVERDSRLRNGMALELNRSNWAVLAINDLAAARDYLERCVFDLLLFNLDISPLLNCDILENFSMKRPGMFSVLYGKNFEVAFSQYNIVEYITPPLSSKNVRHVLQRIQRRSYRASSNNFKRLSEFSYTDRPPIMIDANRSCIIIGSQVIKLSDGEAEILQHIARSPHQIASFQSLAQMLYLQDTDHDEARELVKGRVYRIRQKIEANPDEPTILYPVRGIGFTLCSSVTLLRLS